MSHDALERGGIVGPIPPRFRISVMIRWITIAAIVLSVIMLSAIGASTTLYSAQHPLSTIACAFALFFTASVLWHDWEVLPKHTSWNKRITELYFWRRQWLVICVNVTPLLFSGRPIGLVALQCGIFAMVTNVAVMRAFLTSCP